MLNRQSRPAFTLIEMLVVLSLLVLVSTMAIPSIVKIVKSNADAQAHNLMAGLIRSARTTAIRDGVYTIVHHQLADPASPSNKDAKGLSFAAVMTSKTRYGSDASADETEEPVVTGPVYSLAGGQTVNRIPGTMTFGQIRPAAGSGSTATYTANGYSPTGVGGVVGSSSNQSQVDDFTTFSLAFTPLGGLTSRPNKEDIYFTSDSYSSYTGEGSSLFGGDDPLWNSSVANADTDNNGRFGEPGAKAITMFDYETFDRLEGGDRVDYLDENAQLMPINVLLGMLMERR